MIDADLLLIPRGGKGTVSLVPLSDHEPAPTRPVILTIGDGHSDRCAAMTSDQADDLADALTSAAADARSRV